MKDQTTLLSICIGTYNRISLLLPTVQNILRCPSDDFEIVILDNASSDNTVEILRNIGDTQVKVFQNETNIGGIKNPCKAVTLASGKYALMLWHFIFRNTDSRRFAA